MAATPQTTPITPHPSRGLASAGHLRASIQVAAVPAGVLSFRKELVDHE